MSSSESPDMAALSQDTVPLSEMDKAAVLTLIREEVQSWHTLNQTPLISLNLNLLKSQFFRPHFLLPSAIQIITKEIEVNEWKRKYEESRAEVLEMRYDASLFSPESQDTFQSSKQCKSCLIIHFSFLTSQENSCRIWENSCTDDR